MNEKEKEKRELIFAFGIKGQKPFVTPTSVYNVLECSEKLCCCAKEEVMGKGNSIMIELWREK